MPTSRGPSGPQRRARARAIAALAAACCLLAASCGGDDGDDASSGPGTTAAPLTGDPIKVMTVAPVNTEVPPYPNIPAAAEVYEQWVNDRGGINGRPLEVTTCDTKGDPNEAAACGRQAVEQGMVAVVGSFTFDASQLVSVLEEGGVPWFGACCPLVEQEFTSPYSFVLGSLFPAQGVGAVLKMVEDGCENIVQLFVDIPAADLGLTFTNNALESVGYDLSKQKVVKIPLAAQDYSAQVAQATDGTDCIYGGISDSNWAAWLPAMEAAGADQRLYGLQGNLNTKIVEEFPELTENAVISNSYPHIDGPMWKDYRDALEQYDAPDLDWNSLAGLGTWAAYTAFTQIASGLDDITAETFFEAANATTALDTGGMLPVLDLTEPYEGAGGALPRIVNRSVYFDIAHGGEVEPLETEPLDVTNAIEGKPL